MREKTAKRGHPKFARPNYGRVKRVGSAWRRPRGIDSKQRVALLYAGAKPRIGYGTPKPLQGLHPSGVVEKIVSRPGDVKAIKANYGSGAFAARIASGVGGKKRAEIRKVAHELGVRVLN